MAQGKVELGNRLLELVHRLIAKANDQNSKLAALEARCRDLESQLEAKTIEANQLQQSLDAYKTAAVLSNVANRDEQDVQQVKQRIGLIVREIDKCIALLKQ